MPQPLDNAPVRLNMQHFMNRMNGFGQLAKSCRFAVVIKPVGSLILKWTSFSEDLMYLTEIVEMPGRGFMNFDIRYYGPNHKLPYQSTYEDLNITMLCRSNSLERKFFDDWMTIINPINSFDFNYRDDYRAEIDVFQYSEVAKDEGLRGTGWNRQPQVPEPKYNITIHNVYPILVNPQPMTWGDDQIQRLIVSFTYTHWSRKGFDPESGTYDLVKGRDVDR